MKLAKERIHFQGLPARICWLGYGERAEFGVAMNELVRQRRESKRPSSSVAIIWIPVRWRRPIRETEGMLDGSDAIADWPLLNALVNHRRCGASWISIHNGGGVGIGYSQHAGTGRCCKMEPIIPNAVWRRVADQRSGNGYPAPRLMPVTRAPIEFAAANDIEHSSPLTLRSDCDD